MIKKLLSLGVLLLSFDLASAQDVDLSNKLIQEYNSYRKERSAESSLRSHRPITSSCLNSLILDARKNWNNLTDEAKNTFRTYLSRPSYSGTEVIVTSANFDYHYTLTGADAIPSTDADGSGYPDYIENMAAIFENCWTQYTNRNFAMPPFDGAEGGSQYYDIYVGDLGTGLYGFVSPENNIGNNPQSGTTEVSAYTSWMGMNKDYSWAPGITETQAIQVTAAHEFFHAVQFGTTSETTNFLAEATAAWSEDEIYPGIDDNFQYIVDVFNRPDIALNWNRNDGNSGSPYSSHWYGPWIFFRYMTEHTSTDIIRAIYGRTISQPNDLEAINLELTSNWNSSLRDMFEKAYISFDVLSSTSSYAPYTFSRASNYVSYLSSSCSGVCYEDGYSYAGTQLVHHSNTDGNHRLMRMSADYLDIASNQNFSVRLTKNNQNAQLDIILLKYDFAASTVVASHSTLLGNDPIIRITDNANYDAYTLLVERIDRTVTDTLSEQYTITLDNATVDVEEIPQSDISVYPNPASDNFMIENRSKAILSHMELKDITGKLIQSYRFESASGTQRISASDLQSGYYIATLYFDNGAISTQKIIIQK